MDAGSAADTQRAKPRMGAANVRERAWQPRAGVRELRPVELVAVNSAEVARHAGEGSGGGWFGAECGG
jgi:hypothetical protein